MSDSEFHGLQLAGGRTPKAAEQSGAAAEAGHLAWCPVRAPPKDHDRVLLSLTHLWLRRIPSRFHPKHLCRYHPHLANLLAQCWGKKARVEQFMDDLLIDHRGGRKGFSERVVMELQRLERFHAMRPGISQPAASARIRIRWPDEEPGDTA